ncbi:hypothetical protein ACFELO_09745 [Oceanicaulis sp. LC35]|uniref:hypothetical protein n=1 Tax=Oceanicaulis sp. LC35 TaxID=3349635 RepID=UPI003F82D676
MRHAFVCVTELETEDLAMTRLTAASIFLSRRMRLLVMAAIVIGCLKMGLDTQAHGPVQSGPVHASADIMRDSNAERTQGPDKD